MAKIKIKSQLSFQNIYDYEETPNILEYEGIKMPCVAHFTSSNFIQFDVRTYLNEKTLQVSQASEYIDINDVPFYVSFHVVDRYTVRGVLITKFVLTSKEPFDIEHIDLTKGVFTYGED